MICLDAFQSKKHLAAVVCNFRTFVGLFISSIWLKYGMKSYFTIQIPKWILKVPVIFACQKTGKCPWSAYTCPPTWRIEGDLLN